MEIIFCENGSVFVKAKTSNDKLSLIGLTAIVLSAMVGGGIFDLPKDMAANAGAAGQILAWLFTGIGMCFITIMFMYLSQLQPQLTTGLYKYGEQGFGKFTGFLVSWGYWICECFTNVTYAVLVMSTLNYFLPGYFTGGNNWLAIILASIIFWCIFLIITRGVKSANHTGLVGTIGMLIAVAIFLIVMLVNFNWHTFLTNFQASQNIATLHDKNLGSVSHQVLKTLSVTLWVFGGIEGAVVLSDRARSQQQVRHATILGFMACVILYSLASLLPLGSASYGEIAQISSPSTAQLLTNALHSSMGHIIISVGLIVSVLASWLTWTMMLAEMPFAAAKDKAFPHYFAKENKKHVPIFSLFMATCVMQVILIFAHFSHDAFTTMYTIVATLTVPPYLISALYLVKLSWQNKLTQFQVNKTLRWRALLIGVLATIYIVIMGLAAGVNNLSIAFIIYALGIPFFIQAQHDYAPHQKAFGKIERWFAIAIIVIACVGVYLLIK